MIQLNNSDDDNQGIGAGAPPSPIGGREGIACAQINLHKCFTANFDCNNWLGQNPGQQKIALFTEQYNSDNEVKGFDYNLFNIFTIGSNGRAGIATTKIFKFTCLLIFVIGIKQ